MNDFDFYTIEAYSSSKKALYEVGTFRPDSLKTHTDWGGRYPKRTYTVTIGYVDVMNIGHMEARKRADELVGSLPNVLNVKYHVRFFPRD